MEFRFCHLGNRPLFCSMLSSICVYLFLFSKFHFFLFPEFLFFFFDSLSHLETEKEFAQVSRWPTKSLREIICKINTRRDRTSSKRPPSDMITTAYKKKSRKNMCMNVVVDRRRYPRDLTIIDIHLTHAEWAEYIKRARRPKKKIRKTSSCGDTVPTISHTHTQLHFKTQQKRIEPRQTTNISDS